jgi:hypothetical protein
VTTCPKTNANPTERPAIALPAKTFAPGVLSDVPHMVDGMNEDASTETQSTDMYAPTTDKHDDAVSGETIGASSPGEANTTEKDPSDWVTGDEPMTGAQRSYLDTLAREAGEQLSADLTKAEASENIDRLQQETGRGA